MLVIDAEQAFEASVAHGAVPVQPPTILRDEATGSEQTVAEIALYGDCILRFVSGSYQVCSAINEDQEDWNALSDIESKSAF